MKSKISITDCWRAIALTQWSTVPGIPLMRGGEQVFITEVQLEGLYGKHWVSGNRRLTRQEQELLTQQARAIIEKANPPLI